MKKRRREKKKKKKGGKGLGCGEWGLSKGEVWWWAGPMLRTHRAGKGLGGCGGCGLGSRSRRGPGMPPTAGLRGQGTSPGSSAGFLGSVGGANALLSSLAPPVWEGPSCLPLLISLASGAPIPSGLHFSYPLSPPTSYWFTLGFLPSPWASESLTSSRQAP